MCDYFGDQDGSRFILFLFFFFVLHCTNHYFSATCGITSCARYRFSLSCSYLETWLPVVYSGSLLCCLFHNDNCYFHSLLLKLQKLIIGTLLYHKGNLCHVIGVMRQTTLVFLINSCHLSTEITPCLDSFFPFVEQHYLVMFELAMISN